MRAPRRVAAALSPPAHVFAYGSLVAAARGDSAGDGGGRLAELPGFSRGWGVAMDNRRDLPGYKYYTDRDGRRPPVLVAFPDLLDEGPGACVRGVLVPVQAGDLDGLDRRERNYRRVQVSARGSRGEPVAAWAYLGTPAARARLAAGRRALREAREEGIAVIHAGYLRDVLAGFERFGAEALAAIRADLAPGELPVRELIRHELGA